MTGTPLWLTILLTVITLSITVIGLIVNNYFSNLREQRKEERSSLDGILEILDNLEDRAIDFNTNSEYSAKDQNFLNRNVAHLKRKLDTLGIPEEENLEMNFARMRIAMLKNGATESEFTSLSHSADEVNNISYYKGLITDSIDKYHKDKFRLEPNRLLRRLVNWK